MKVEIIAFTDELNVSMRWIGQATDKKHVSLGQFEAVYKGGFYNGERRM